MGGLALGDARGVVGGTSEVWDEGMQEGCDSCQMGDPVGSQSLSKKSWVLHNVIRDDDTACTCHHTHDMVEMANGNLGCVCDS